ncbi:aldo/keto reductase [Bacillus taeanensis]|uniref:Aldo/keto reductase n=1 Tax=Bacillus taeanensis TaxID=273032 RepID=A0A366Y2E5_9BACI|nr:aldo/keto reductase [Bacillus taeanensis]RBW70381.1 aldo/keto reductase [Bacillus taeanensis]
MKKNQLGNSDLYVSEIGLGSMSLKNENESIRMIHQAIERGVNYLDTADLYDFGKNEEVIGNAIKGKRDQVIIGTKVGNRWEEGKEGWYWDPSKQYIKEAVKNSLKRLNIEYIDLYQLHGGTIEDNIDETIEAFEELKEEGIIRYYGISSIRPNVIREYVKHSNIVSVMMQYSILDRRPEEEILSFLQENNISVIARGPLAKGMLTEQVEAKIREDGFLDSSKNDILLLANKLRETCGTSHNLTQLALRYALSHPAVATTIPGASSMEQLQENLSAANVREFTKAEITLIQQLSKENKYDKHR